jgi:hypothetical protein
MEAMDLAQLDERTRLRNAATWVRFDWGGLLDPLTDTQEAMDDIARASIENFMAISDEAWAVKQYQRDKGAEIAQAEVDQDWQIAGMKVATGREKLRIIRAADEYFLAARVYDAKSKAQVMASREYAGLVEQTQLAVEAQRTGLAISKEELRRKEVNAKIYYEIVQRAQVEADLARAQVDVAKAHVRAVIAGIEAGEAEVKLIESQVAAFMAEAEKSTLKAEVASIHAEILTKQLSKIKLDVGRAEIEAGFKYIASRLEDELSIWETRENLESVQASFEASLRSEVSLELSADEVQEDLKEEEVQRNLAVHEYEITATDRNLQQERDLKDTLVESREDLLDAKLDSSEQQDDKRTWATALVNTAQRYVHKHSERGTTAYETSYEYISG